MFWRQDGRTLFFSGVDPTTTDESLYSTIKAVGEVRTLYFQFRPKGIVLVAYFDLQTARAAQTALDGRRVGCNEILVNFSVPVVRG
jgi:hypothetical protein